VGTNKDEQIGLERLAEYLHRECEMGDGSSEQMKLLVVFSHDGDGYIAEYWEENEGDVAACFLEHSHCLSDHFPEDELKGRRGLAVWEGYCTYDYEEPEFHGSWRLATESELKALHKGKRPWPRGL